MPGYISEMQLIWEKVSSLPEIPQNRCIFSIALKCAEDNYAWLCIQNAIILEKSISITRNPLKV